MLNMKIHRDETSSSHVIDNFMFISSSNFIALWKYKMTIWWHSSRLDFFTKLSYADLSCINLSLVQVLFFTMYQTCIKKSKRLILSGSRGVIYSKNGIICNGIFQWRQILAKFHYRAINTFSYLWPKTVHEI